MDPDATLARIIDAAVGSDANDLIEAAQDLAEWLDNNGFAPQDPRPIRSAEGTIVGG